MQTIRESAKKRLNGEAAGKMKKDRCVIKKRGTGAAVNTDGGFQNKAAWACLFTIVVTCSVLAGMDGRERRQRDIAGQIIRFHVIANSDSQRDQELKREVRDDIAAYLEEAMPDFTDRAEAEAYLDKEKENLENIAASRITGEGFAYPVRVERGSRYFQEKAFGPYVFPEGKYEALCLTIGDGKGHNWWGVMYPNLCFAQGASREVSRKGEQKLRSVLTEEEYQSLLSAKPGRIKIKFKIPEYLSKLVGDRDGGANFEECLE